MFAHYLYTRSSHSVVQDTQMSTDTRQMGAESKENVSIHQPEKAFRFNVFPRVTYHGIIGHFNAQVTVAVSVLQNHSDLQTQQQQLVNL